MLSTLPASVAIHKVVHRTNVAAVVAAAAAAVKVVVLERLLRVQPQNRHLVRQRPRVVGVDPSQSPWTCHVHRVSIVSVTVRQDLASVLITSHRRGRNASVGS